MNSLCERSFWASRGLALAILALTADLGWSAPPVRFRPPVRTPVPDVTPIRPPAEAFIPPAGGPSVRGGALPEETMRGGSSLRPVPFVPIRPRPDERADDDRSAGVPDRSSGAWPLWWLLLIVPVAGLLVLLVMGMLLIDVFGKRRSGSSLRQGAAKPAAPDRGRSHLNPRWSPSSGK